MPAASTGGVGGRANTPVPRVPPGQIRIDINSVTGDVVFSDTYSTGATDRIIEVRSETGPYGVGSLTYSCEGGYSFTVPSTWRSGDTIPSGELTWAATRREYERIDITTFGDAVPRYAAGQRITAADFNHMPDYTSDFANVVGQNRITGRITATCGCGLCQQERAETPEQTARREAEEREDYLRARAAARERQAQKDAAEARAEETLRMVLNPAELRNYEKTHQIIVTGADGRQYKIEDGLVNNVQLLNKRGGPVAVLCCHPDLSPGINYRDRLPTRDAHVAQVLYLRHDLDKFWQTANTGWYDEKARDKYFDEFPSRRPRAGGAWRIVDRWDT